MSVNASPIFFFALLTPKDIWLGNWGKGQKRNQFLFYFPKRFSDIIALIPFSKFVLDKKFQQNDF